MKKQKSILVKTGSSEDFMNNVKNVMSAADRGEAIVSSHTLVFEDPTEMLRFLSETKIKLISAIRKQPDNITNIAKATQRNRAAVYRDIHELKKFGLVATYDEINPGHGRYKIVQLVASELKLEARI